MKPARTAWPACWTGWCGWHVLLLPLSLLFGFLAFLRRLLYGLHILPQKRLPVPVIVVGNITVGGSGKTPLTVWLAQELSKRGYRPGIVSRGYGGTLSNVSGVAEVHPDSHSGVVGDEPLLLARGALCPVFVGRDRAAAGAALLAAHPQCDVIICDDGLQHYRLARTVELAVLDERDSGNGLLLPAGPLREGRWRLATVLAVVRNGGAGRGENEFAMQLVPRGFYSLANPAERYGPEVFAGRWVHAVAGIGNPERFFATLRQQGIEHKAHAFPDHHDFSVDDFKFVRPDGWVLMTEKDAVKCRHLVKHSPALQNAWVCVVSAELPAGLLDRIEAQLQRKR